VLDVKNEEGKMELKIKKSFLELEISDFDKDERTIEKMGDKKERKYDKNKKYLNIYSSIMAPQKGKFSDSLIKNEDKSHRVDWQFGVTAPSLNKGEVFDWKNALRPERSISIQVLINSPDPKCECIVTYADINGFKPLNTMKDKSTNYLSLVGSIFGKLSPVPILSATMNSLVKEKYRKDAAEYENRFKNMFRLFRFLTDKGDQGVEYILSKDVLDQWGTFLRGSLGLCFFSESPTSNNEHHYQIRLIPQLGFKKDDNLCYLPRPEDHEKIDTKITVSVGM